MNDYKVGDIIEGEVTGVTSYGVFVKLDGNYKGLIHISEISGKYISNIEKLFSKSEKITAKVIDIDEDNKTVRLSIKQLGKNKKNSKLIQEKGDGFKPLKTKLSIWIKEKLKELKK